MKVKIIGAGVWSRGLTSFAELCASLATAELAGPSEFPPPKPEAIPARERRRAGLMINLAVTAAHQACEHAAVDKAQVPSIFTSCMGDTDITDYMCRKLAQPEKLLSPTKFHNSVHNAPSGYWTISASNRTPSSFVGGGEYSFGLGLLEAASTCLACNAPVLLVAYDIANSQPFADILPVTETFASALVLAPETHADGADLGVAVELSTEQNSAVDTPRHSALRALANANPSAQSLTLLEALAEIHTGSQDHAQITLAAGADLRLTIQAGTI